jgi:hypothetical protein
MTPAPLRLCLGALTLAFTAAGHAVELNPAAVTSIKPGDFKWRDPENKGQNNGVSLWGDGAKDEGVTVLIVGEGPATSTPAEEK